MSKRLYLRDELSSGKAFLITRKELVTAMIVAFLVGMAGGIAIIIAADTRPIECDCLEPMKPQKPAIIGSVSLRFGSGLLGYSA